VVADVDVGKHDSLRGQRVSTSDASDSGVVSTPEAGIR
jgi:hypothetical protein